MAIAIPLSFEAILKQQRLAFSTHREYVNIHDQQIDSFILQENEGSHNFSTSPNWWVNKQFLRWFPDTVNYISDIALPT